MGGVEREKNEGQEEDGGGEKRAENFLFFFFQSHAVIKEREHDLFLPLRTHGCAGRERGEIRDKRERGGISSSPLRVHVAHMRE